MKTKFLLLPLLLFSFLNIAQTDDWYLLTKASQIDKIQRDDVNTNELHLATDIGYIKYNTTTNQVTDFLNLTSQNPAIGKVKDIALDPTSNKIALALKDGIAIYDGAIVTNYNYSNSNLTIGEGTNQFIFLKVEYAKDGSLYIFKEDDFGYQIFNNGSFDAEIVTSFKPQDVVENNAGTKAYFAGSNNGLWELEKATTTWVNHTTSNSDIFTNFITALSIDVNDNLIIGHYQGLNKMEPNGTITSCNASSPVPVLQIDISPTTGEIIVRNSRYGSPNTYGFSIVDFNSCSWTNYIEDGTNCLDDNIYFACSFGGNGMVYVAPQKFINFSETGRLVEFNPSTDSCSTLDFNYLNAPLAINHGVITDFSVRKKASGNLDISFTRSSEFNIVEIDPMNFNGSFPMATTLTPGGGIGSVISDNEHFILDTNTGWLFFDDNNNMVEFSHNIPNYIPINTKKASVFDSDSGTINIVHKGFDASFNYRVYKTQCNTSTGTCSTSEEIFTNDRDLSQNIIWGAYEDPITNKVDVVAIKKDNSGNIKRTSESWDSDQPAVSNWDRIHDAFPRFDPVTFSFVVDDLVNITSLFAPPDKTVLNKREDGSDGSATSTDTTNDFNNDGENDEVVAVSREVIGESEGNGVALAFVLFAHIEGGSTRGISMEEFNINGDGTNRNESSRQNVTIPDASINNNLPNDIFINKVEFKQYSPTEVFMVMLTNYGMLVKTGVDISGLSLGTEEFNLTDSKVALYPNPANDIVSFSDSLIKQIEVFDINGRKVLIGEENSISVNTLSKGVYIVKGITSKNISITRKLIKN